MLAVVATIRTQPGKGADFEAVFVRLAAAVRQNEPGNKLYQLTRSRTDADTYKVLEIYQNDEAVAAHRAADHFREIGREMGAFMAGRPDVEILDTVD